MAFNAARGFSLVQNDPAAASSALSVEIQDAYRGAAAAAFEVSVAVPEDETAGFRRWLGLANVKLLATTVVRQHPTGRAARNILEQLMMSGHLGTRRTICLVGGVRSEAERWQAYLPHARIVVVTFLGGPKDVCRLHDAVDGESGWARAFRLAGERPDTLLTPVTAWAGAMGPLPAADDYVLIDAALNMPFAWFASQVRARGASSFWSVHHSCAELRDYPENVELPHYDLPYRWARTARNYVMTWDGEQPYYHPPEVCESWWRPQPGWGYAFEGGGPGYRITRYFTLAAPGEFNPQWQWADTIRVFLPRPFFEEGRIETRYMFRELYVAMEALVAQYMSNPNKVIAPDNVIMWIRGRHSLYYMVRGQEAVRYCGLSLAELVSIGYVAGAASSRAMKSALRDALRSELDISWRTHLLSYLWTAHADARRVLACDDFARMLSDFRMKPTCDSVPQLVLAAQGPVRSLVAPELQELAALDWLVAPNAPLPPPAFNRTCATKFEEMLASYAGPFVVIGSQPHGMAFIDNFGRGRAPWAGADVRLCVERYHLRVDVPHAPGVGVTLCHSHGAARVPVYRVHLDGDPRASGRESYARWLQLVLDNARVVRVPNGGPAAGGALPSADYVVYDSSFAAVDAAVRGETIVSDVCDCTGYHWAADANGAGLVPCAFMPVYLHEVMTKVAACGVRAVVKVNAPYADVLMSLMAQRTRTRVRALGTWQNAASSEQFYEVVAPWAAACDWASAIAEVTPGLALTDLAWTALQLLLLVVAVCAAPAWVLAAGCVLTVAAASARWRLWGGTHARALHAVAPVLMLGLLGGVLAAAFTPWQVAFTALRAFATPAGCARLLTVLGGRAALLTYDVHWRRYVDASAWARPRLLAGLARRLRAPSPAALVGRPTAWDELVGARGARRHAVLTSRAVAIVDELYDAGADQCAFYRDRAGVGPLRPLAPLVGMRRVRLGGYLDSTQPGGGEDSDPWAWSPRSADAHCAPGGGGEARAVAVETVPRVALGEAGGGMVRMPAFAEYVRSSVAPVVTSPADIGRAAPAASAAPAAIAVPAAGAAAVVAVHVTAPLVAALRELAPCGDAWRYEVALSGKAAAEFTALLPPGDGKSGVVVVAEPPQPPPLVRTVRLSRQRPAGPHKVAGRGRDAWFVAVVEPVGRVIGSTPYLFGECASVATSQALHGHSLGAWLPASPLHGMWQLDEGQVKAVCDAHGLGFVRATGEVISVAQPGKASVVVDATGLHAEYSPLVAKPPLRAALKHADLEPHYRVVRFADCRQNELASAIAASLKRSTHDPALPTYDDLHVGKLDLTAAQTVAPLKSRQRCREVRAVQVRGAPGSAKTWSLAELALDHRSRRPAGTQIAIAPVRVAIRELIEAYYALCGKRAQNDCGADLYTATYIRALVPDPDGQRGPPVLPAPQIEVVYADETLLLHNAYLAVYAELFPNARFVLFGDPQQCWLDETADYNRIPVPRTPAQWRRAQGAGELLKAAYDLGPTRRYGDESARALGVLANAQGASHVTSAIHRGLSVRVMTREELMAADERVQAALLPLITMMRPDRTQKEQGVRLPEAASVMESQGSSRDYVAVWVDKPFLAEFRARGKRFPGTMLVALSRHRYGIVFVYDPKVVPKAVVMRDVVDKYVAAAAGLLGGDFLRQVGDGHPAMAALGVLYGGVRAPTVRRHAGMGRGDEYPRVRFDFAAISHGELPYGNAVRNSAMVPFNADGRVRIRDNYRGAADRELLLVTETGLAHRHHAAAGLQVVGTASDRRAAAQLAQRLHDRRDPYSIEPVRAAQIAEQAYVDPQKFERFVNTKLRDLVVDDVLAHAFNEFGDSVKPWSERDGEATLRNFMDAITDQLTYTLKTQAKGKDLASVDRVKAGQPIAAMSKRMNLTWGILFRVVDMLQRECLRDWVHLGARGTMDELAARLTRPGQRFSYVLMTDAQQFDASHTRQSNAEVAAWFQIFNPLRHDIANLYVQLNGAYVVNPLVSYALGDDLSSGAPDTFMRNVAKNKIDLAVSGYYGRYGSLWWVFVSFAAFYGDDNAVGCAVDPRELFALEWYARAYPLPLKVTVVRNAAYFEFVHHLFGHGRAAYISEYAVAKLLSRNYADVVATDAKWAEFMTSWSDMAQTWKCGFYAAVAGECEWFGEPPTSVEVRLANLIAFASMTRAQALRELPLRRVQAEAGASHRAVAAELGVRVDPHN